MDSNNFGCCNMIIWDVFIVFLFTAVCIPFPLHAVFKITLGILAAILFFILLSIPILGIILQLFCCYVWYEIFYELLPIEKWTAGDTAALYFCRFLLGLAILILHFTSFASLVMEHEPPSIDLHIFHHQAKSNKGNFYQEEYQQSYSDFAREDFSQQGNRDSQSQNESSNQSADNAFHPFFGCNDLESLKKRYQKLAKTYHPDEATGNTEAFKYIQSEYERLLKEYD